MDTKKAPDVIVKEEHKEKPLPATFVLPVNGEKPKSETNSTKEKTNEIPV